MSPNKKFSLSKLNYKAYSYALLFLAAFLACAITYALYNQTRQILEDRLKERLVSIVSTAALQFSPSDIQKVHDVTSVGTPAYTKLVNRLQLIRNANKNVKFAYLLRPTDNPDAQKFIADADSINPTAEVDLNSDGIIDENDELVTPGDDYDISDVLALKQDAINFPTTDKSLVTDQWGSTLSAYAPIKSKGQTVAILGIDVDVSDFIVLITGTFVPFALFIVFLLLLLTILTVFLVKAWQQRVNVVEELDRQKDELLGIVSHQLAKPITAIKWTLESMLDGDTGNLNAQQKESAETMQTMAVNLADLVSMILDVSRIQLGRVKLDPQSLDLNAFFKEILDVIEPTVKQKKINFVKNISPKELPTVLLDRRYTRMTVENLLTNAVKYTPEGGTVTLDVSIKNGVFSCSVKDTGCGIPKEDQGKIFGKMFRASNVRNTVEGNGFGLYVAKGAVEGQGGEMSFDSTEGKGTRFWFKMPVKDPAKAS